METGGGGGIGIPGAGGPTGGWKGAMDRLSSGEECLVPADSALGWPPSLPLIDWPTLCAGLWRMKFCALSLSSFLPGLYTVAQIGGTVCRVRRGLGAMVAEVVAEDISALPVLTMGWPFCRGSACCSKGGGRTPCFSSSFSGRSRESSLRLAGVAARSTRSRSGPITEAAAMVTAAAVPAEPGRLGSRVLGETLKLRSLSLCACDWDRRCNSLGAGLS